MLIVVAVAFSSFTLQGLVPRLIGVSGAVLVANVFALRLRPRQSNHEILRVVCCMTGAIVLCSLSAFGLMAIATEQQAYGTPKLSIAVGVTVAGMVGIILGFSATE